MFRFVSHCIVLAVMAVSTAATAQDSEGAGASAYFIEPLDGATVTSPVRIIFGLSGMGVAPAGVDFPNSGHHHVLIDVDELPPMDMPLPATEQIVHFGLGQTEAVLELTPGEHTLQMIVGDMLHTPHETPVMSEKITITVTE